MTLHKPLHTHMSRPCAPHGPSAPHQPASSAPSSRLGPMQRTTESGATPPDPSGTDDPLLPLLLFPLPHCLPLPLMTMTAQCHHSPSERGRRSDQEGVWINVQIRTMLMNASMCSSLTVCAKWIQSKSPSKGKARRGVECFFILKESTGYILFVTENRCQTAHDNL